MQVTFFGLGWNEQSGAVYCADPCIPTGRITDLPTHGFSLIELENVISGRRYLVDKRQIVKVKKCRKTSKKKSR